MALIKCPECKKEISDTTQACPNCGYDLKASKRKLDQAKAAKGCGQGCGIGCLVIFVIAVIIALTTGPTRNEKPIRQGNEKTIPYTVVGKWEKAAAFGMDILVDEAASKEDVMSLAKSLQRQNNEGKYCTINIFDSREAQRRRLDEEYSEKELFRHWLVAIVAGGEKVMKSKDHQEIRWVAEERDH
jgi:DNA-directed RNA polymerase subunit RPC12/RpoP